MSGTGGGGYGASIGNMYGGLPQNWGGRGSYLGQQFGGRGQQGQYSPPSNYNYGGFGPYNTMTQDMATQQMGSGVFNQGQFGYQGAGFPGSYGGYDPYGYGGGQGANPYGGGYGFGGGYGGGYGGQQRRGSGISGLFGRMFDRMGQQGQGPYANRYGFGGGGMSPPPWRGAPPPRAMPPIPPTAPPIMGGGMAQAFPNAQRSVQPAQQVEPYLNYRSPFAGGGQYTKYGPNMAMY